MDKQELPVLTKAAKAVLGIVLDRYSIEPKHFDCLMLSLKGLVVPRSAGGIAQNKERSVTRIVFTPSFLPTKEEAKHVFESIHFIHGQGHPEMVLLYYEPGERYYWYHCKCEFGGWIYDHEIEDLQAIPDLTHKQAGDGLNLIENWLENKHHADAGRIMCQALALAGL